MQQNNNIENKLRQLDNQQEPDLSQMDNHWQQMQAMLQPGTTPTAKGGSGALINGSIISFIIIAIAAFVYFLPTNKTAQNAEQTSINKPVETKNITAPAKTDTTTNAQIIPAPLQQSISVVQNIHPAQTVKYSDYITEEDSVLSKTKFNLSPCDICPAKKSDSTTSSINRIQLLQNLFTQLNKEEQLYTIDNRRDTLLQFKEGTTLLIPANSFNGKDEVELTVQEFYKHSDMILNQLTTLSNKDQLVTGGMLFIKASYKGNEVAIKNNNPLRLYMPDTSSNMNGMQLFNGESSKGNFVNWIPQYQYFARTKIVTEVRVLNIIDQPFKTKQKRKGEVGYFIVSDSIAVEKDKLKEILKEKFGYYKIKLRPDFRNWFEEANGNRAFDNVYSTRIGDSVWMPKENADKYRLKYTAQRQFATVIRGEGIAINEELTKKTAALFKDVQDKYSVNLNSLGWINCDRFYNFPGEKFQFAVNLEDSAKNYYTVLVFDNINSMMNGYINGNKVLFPNVPAGMPVKIVSIGINKEGEPVYTVKQATTGKEELTGLVFETTSAANLKTALSRIDK